jgi:hypothetical protein
LFSAAAIFDSILNRAPVPAVRLNPDVTAELERIIYKALEKDQNLRYQHAADMRTDLQRLKRDSESGRTSVARSGTVVVPETSSRSGREALENYSARPARRFACGGRNLLLLACPEGRAVPENGNRPTNHERQSDNSGHLVGRKVFGVCHE